MNTRRPTTYSCFACAYHHRPSPLSPPVRTYATSRLSTSNHPKALRHRRTHRLGRGVPRSQPQHPSRDHPCSHHAGGPARASPGENGREAIFQGLFAVAPQHERRRCCRCRCACFCRSCCRCCCCCSYSDFGYRHDRGGEVGIGIDGECYQARTAVVYLIYTTGIRHHHVALG